MEYGVTMQLNGCDVPCGRLFVNATRGKERSSFVYNESYLSRNDAFAISPDLPLGQATQHSVNGPLFAAFQDCMPDRWGRSLMQRAERLAARQEHRTARTLFEGQYLAGVSDVARQGAIRVWKANTPLASSNGVPREVDLPRLLTQADLAAQDIDADVRDLLQAGSSLGGARPKASVRDEHGHLCIAKFPKADESHLEDTCAWEHVALTLAKQCGLSVPSARLIRIAGRGVLILSRFDRRGDERIPYLSGMSAVQGTDGGDYSYLELVDFLEQEGARTASDVRQLWKRVLFSCAIGNTDDHMRNHGFLRARDGWMLSPLFDVNPTPGNGDKYLSCAIDFDEQLAHPSAALDACEEFRMKKGEAKREAHAMAKALGAWHRIAVADGISNASIARMQSCLEAGISRLAAL
jgi:serine/threonine-protein kinase HipA